MSKPTSGEVLLGMIERGYRPQSPRPTPGPWLDDRARGSRHGAAPVIVADKCWRGNQTREVAKVLFHGGSEDPEVQANAALIVAAINSCFAVNPENPLAVAEALPEIIRALNTAIWIKDRLDEKGAWGRGFEEWEDIRAALAKMEGIEKMKGGVI